MHFDNNFLHSWKTYFHMDIYLVRYDFSKMEQKLKTGHSGNVNTYVLKCILYFVYVKYEREEKKQQ